MPYVKIQTNITIAPDVQRTLLATVSRQVADALNKPERYVMVEANGDAPLVFGGSDDPAAYVELKSIGLADTQTQQLSQIVCTMLKEELGIDPARTYIEFIAIPRAFWGWNGSTF